MNGCICVACFSCMLTSMQVAAWMHAGGYLYLYLYLRQVGSHEGMVIDVAMLIRPASSSTFSPLLPVSERNLFAPWTEYTPTFFFPAPPRNYSSVVDWPPPTYILAIYLPINIANLPAKSNRGTKLVWHCAVALCR